MTRFLIPLFVFLVLVGFLGFGLTLDPRHVPSPLIDKPAPGFSLPSVWKPDTTLDEKTFSGKVWLFNVWASWCVACRSEHPLLVELAKQNIVPIYGLNYKDTRPNAQRWLNMYGDPYIDSAFDEAGRVGIEWGVYGVPETFIVDRAGIIRYKHVGPINPQVLETTILPIIRTLEKET